MADVPMSEVMRRERGEAVVGLGCMHWDGVSLCAKGVGGCRLRGWGGGGQASHLTDLHLAASACEHPSFTLHPMTFFISPPLLFLLLHFSRVPLHPQLRRPTKGSSWSTEE